MSILAGGIVIALILFYIIATYNRLVSLQQNVQESWSAVETELRRRFDLIPNLVETVKGYAAHERGTLEAVIEARNHAAANIASPEALASSQNVLTGALSKLFALSESYPELKANENFRQLETDLADTETRISQSRRFYNANVRELNMLIQSFPAVLFSRALGFREKQYFGVDDPAALEPVAVKFDSTQPTTSSQSISLKTSLPVQEKDKS
jgi:LemA protein